MMKYPVLCVCAPLPSQNSCLACTAFVFNVWTGFIERVHVEMSYHAQNVARKFGSQEVEIPASFPPNITKINSLLDVLAIKECSTTGLKCGNCDKRSANCFYCFQCCFFWCESCITAHNIIRANKEHRVLAIKDFQDRDIEDVLKRPAFCQIKRHEYEALKFFCKKCKIAICNACALTEHEGHTKVLLEDGANEHRLRMESLIKSLDEKAEEKRNEISELDPKLTHNAFFVLGK